MALRIRTRIRLRQLLVIMLVAGLVTPPFNVLTSEMTWLAVVQGVVDAVLVSLLVGTYVLFVRDGHLRLWFRRHGFLVDLALNGLALLVLFMVGRAIGQVLVRGDIVYFRSSFSDPHLAVALPFFALMAFAIQFVMQMNRLIGTNVLRYFATGAYREPKEEQRIFLFIDLDGSTRLAEQLGSARYFALLRRFVDDVSAAVQECEGEIYQYVGDEVVVIWPFAAGVRNANCVRCFFAIRSAMQGHARSYVRAFGVVPGFRGGLHGGQVTGGEIGDQRQQIVFVGDILNTAARLQQHAKHNNLDLVGSDDLLAQVGLPDSIRARPCGDLALRGKGAPVTASSLHA